MKILWKNIKNYIKRMQKKLNKIAKDTNSFLKKFINSQKNQI